MTAKGDKVAKNTGIYDEVKKKCRGTDKIIRTQSTVMRQLSLWDALEKEAPVTDVAIEGAVNLSKMPISDYKVRLAYGDLTLIVAMLRDYVKGLDAMCKDGDIRTNKDQYEHYCRIKFMSIADRISEQIEYDYDAKLKKCMKKMEKQDNSDVGGEALSLAFKRAQKPQNPLPAKDLKKGIAV